MKKLFCPWCGAGLITRAWIFYLYIPYWLHLRKCANPHGICSGFGVIYMGE